MRSNAFFTAGLLALMFALPTWANQAPDVTNVTAGQRGDESKLVDIYYDLTDADGDACTVWVAMSDDGGATWGVPAFTFSGHVGPGVAPGVGRHIIWDAGGDIPGAAGGNFKARVHADDGTSPGPTVLVPAGLFPYQGTQSVYVGAFMIDQYEITNQFYCQFLNGADPDGDYWVSDQEITRSGTAGNYYYSVQEGRDDYPIRYVSYYDAEAFAAWRTGVEGATYRLPTHHEWEKAAAWDPVEQHYYTYGFHEDSISCPWSNYNNCTGAPTPVGYYDGTGGRENARSYYGCYDMSGNVWEWTSEVSGSYRAVRGGAWSYAAHECQCSYRFNYTPSSRYGFIGFRLVLDME